MRYQKSSNKLIEDNPNRLSLTILTLGYAKPDIADNLNH